VIRDRFEYIDATNIDRAQWPESPEAKKAAKYLSPFIRHGTNPYLLNGTATVSVLVIGSRVIPVVAPESRDGQTNSLSILTHYVEYPKRELHKLRYPVLAYPIRIGLVLLGWMSRICGLDRVVYLNNWLWPTNPPVSLSQCEIETVRDFLVQRFPERAIVVRSLNRVVSEGLVERLSKGGFRLIRSRRIFILDPADERLNRSRDLAKDEKLEKKDPLPVRTPERLSDKESERLAEIYRQLYIEKHSDLNAQFTPGYFRILVESGVVEVRLIDCDEQISCVTVWARRPGEMTGVMVGYDLSIPRSRGLLRRAFLIKIHEARKTVSRFNMSAGSGRFKMNRGAVPETEYDAVFYAHLSFCRRLAWKTLHVLMGLWERVEYRFFG
jgi:hypothetical protein